MKWIGQHIWDFISRFRSDVYLEGTESGTIASGGNLGLDSNNKIVKESDTGIIDLHGAGVDGSANQMLTDDGDGTVTSESTLTYDGALLAQTTTPAGNFSAHTNSLTPTSGWATGTNTGTGVFVILDNNVNVASGETNTFKAFQTLIDDDATHVGTVDYVGMYTQIDFANTNGTQGAKGIQTQITDGDTAGMYGVWHQIEDGGKDLYFLSSDATTVDYFSLAVGASGATTMTTVDGGGTAADLTFSVDGSTIFTGPEVVVENATTGMLTVQNTAANATGGILNLKNTHNGSDADVSDFCGYIKFWGQDSGTPALMEYGRISTQITDVTSSEEAATMRLKVLNNTGTGALSDGIAIYGNTNADGEVDVDIASGVASVTTIAGDLDIDGDNMTSAGAMTFTPVGKYTITAPDLTGDVFHLDADADTDNIVNIDAGDLDIDASASIAIDAAAHIVSTSVGRNTMTTSGAAGHITISSAHTAGQAIHIDGDAAAGSIVDIDAGILDIDVTGVTTLDTTELTITGKTIMPSRKYELPDSATDGDHKGGDIYYYGDGATVAGGIYYIDGTNWTLTDADAEASTSGLLAVALGDDPDVHGMLLRGFVTLKVETEGIEAIGSALYLSTTPGTATVTVPGSGDFVRILGYSLSTSEQIYFNPDNTWVEVA